MPAVLICAAVALVACGSSGNGAGAPQSAAERKQSLVERASAGDRKAQFLYGFDLCCGDGGSAGRRSVPEATVWLCRAARQGEPRAQFHLGRIYARSLVDNSLTAKMLRSLGASGGDRARPRIAAMWYDLAMAGGHQGAAHSRLVLNRSLKAEDQLAIEKMRANWHDVPCEWQDVYADGTRAE